MPVIGDVLSNSNISEIISQVTGETVKCVPPRIHLSRIEYHAAAVFLDA